MKAFRNIIIERSKRLTLAGVEVEETRPCGVVMSSDVEGIKEGDTIFYSNATTLEGDLYTVKADEVTAIL